MVEKILNNTTPYGKIRASHEGLLHSSTLSVMIDYQLCSRSKACESEFVSICPNYKGIRVNLGFVIYVVVSLSMLILTVLAARSNVSSVTHILSDRYKVSNSAVYADNVKYDIHSYKITDIQ